MIAVYFAGPDVFRRDAADYANRLREAALDYEIEAVLPVDNEITGHSPQSASLQIYSGNLRKIHRSQAIVGNMDAFRGTEPDSGTAYEIGYGVAAGKPIFLHCSDALDPYVERLIKMGWVDLDRSSTEKMVDLNGFSIENFNLPFNLMLAESAVQIIQGSAFDALPAVSQYFAPERSCVRRLRQP